MRGEALEADVVVARRSGFRLEASVRAAAEEAVAVMGSRGAGASTLLDAIAGRVRLSGGYVRIGGRDVATARPSRHERPDRRGVVLLGPEPFLFPHLSVRENVAFGPRARGVARAEALGDADDRLWHVGLPGAGDRRPRELSDADRHRVAIARALAASPRLVLLDDPLSALDAFAAGEIRGVLQAQLAAAHATVLIATGDAVDAAAIAGRLLILEEGRVTQEGAVRDVLSEPATAFAASISGVNRLVGVAFEGGWRTPDGPVEVVLAAADPAPRAADPASWAVMDSASRAVDPASRTAAADDGTPLAAVFRPDAVRLERPADLTWTGALRRSRREQARPGTWLARVVRLERIPSGVRAHTAEPPVAVDLPIDAVGDLGLAVDVPVRLRLEPDAVRLLPIASAPGRLEP